MVLLNSWPWLLALCLACSIAATPRAHAAPMSLVGTTTQTSNNALLTVSIGDSFAAAIDLDLSRATGQAELRPGISGNGERYTELGGSIEATIGGMSWTFRPLFLVIGNDFVDDAGKVPGPVDIWHLHAVGPHGLLLTIGLWQPDGSAIGNSDLFIPSTTAAFGSATWALFGQSFDPQTGHQSVVASGLIEGWAASSSTQRR
jgi:hypothetical protein